MEYEVSNKKLARSFMIHAKEHFETYECVKNNPGKIKIKYLNLGTALELIFKSYLFQYDEDMSEKILKEKFGHDLEKLLIKFMEFNSNIFSKVEIDLIKHLNLYYRMKDFEYPNIGIFKNYPPTDLLEMIIKKLIRFDNL